MEYQKREREGDEARRKKRLCGRGRKTREREMRKAAASARAWLTNLALTSYRYFHLEFDPWEFHFFALAYLASERARLRALPRRSAEILSSETLCLDYDSISARERTSEPSRIKPRGVNALL